MNGTADLATWEDAVLWLRRRPEHADLVQACFFDDPLIGAAERYYASSEWRAIQGMIGLGAGRVLDIGAGRGTSSYAFARDGWRITALEPDPSPVVGAGAIRALAAESGVAIEVVEAWGEELPFQDAGFDLVYGRQVLHHARDLPAFCREVARVLKPGGTFLATREHVIFKDADLAVFLEKHPLHRLYGEEHAYRLAEYTRAIDDAGIRITRVLNPWASPINLYPRTSQDVAARIRRAVPFVPPFALNPAVLRRLGWLLRSPGTSYSFVGVRAT